jgi:hypothetical protein
MKRCSPDKFDHWRFNHNGPNDCNCEFANCKSKIEIIERDITFKMKEIVKSKRELQELPRSVGTRQPHGPLLLRLDYRMEALLKKEKNVKTFYHLEKMKPALQNVEQNGLFKRTRKQAGNALKELKMYDSWTVHIRRNANYKVHD